MQSRLRPRVQPGDVDQLLLAVVATLTPRLLLRDAAVAAEVLVDDALAECPAAPFAVGVDRSQSRSGHLPTSEALVNKGTDTTARDRRTVVLSIRRIPRFPRDGAR